MTAVAVVAWIYIVSIALILAACLLWLLGRLLGRDPLAGILPSAAEEDDRLRRLREGTQRAEDARLRARFGMDLEEIRSLPEWLPPHERGRRLA